MTGDPKQTMNHKLILLTVLALILLVFYGYTMSMEIEIAQVCDDYQRERFSGYAERCGNAQHEAGGFSSIFSAVGGMISAFAVGLLAVNQPQDGLPTEGLTSSRMAWFVRGVAKALPPRIDRCVDYLRGRCCVVRVKVQGFEPSLGNGPNVDRHRNCGASVHSSD
jgi:hypothetical protein